eukprot:CAMPEP_0117652974 /NCGR_PEP_ID=MMETSP0804-20121206/2935_1 /TAXON_ID=1074897 /ORGANISM="Tetraselmis astigmatica, Strain CCMP880" /LENGTH=267 /DNA_ID=CAMNT_0005459101 /DNA_START=94 /DNA_END=896 /DNA_ORIENTATION=-
MTPSSTSSRSLHTAAARRSLLRGGLRAGIAVLSQPGRCYTRHQHPTHRVATRATAAGDENRAAGDSEYLEYDMNYQAVARQDEGIASEEGYLALKDALFKRTQRGGTFLTLYVFVIVSSPAALCTMIGAATSYLYLFLLTLDVDSRSIEDCNLVMEAEEIESPVGRSLSKALGAYSQALKPRLLLPVALAAGAWWFNQNSETPLGLVEEGCLFLGFSSYKLALVVEVWESLKPRPKTREELDRQERPMLPELEDIEDIRPDLKDEKF